MPPRRARLGLFVVLAALASLPAVAQAAAPDNDDFAGAQTVRVDDRVTGSTADATLEAGEPATSGSLLTRSVWYRLTTGTAERLRIDTCAGDHFTELAVYTGATVSALTDVPHTGGGCGAGSRFYFTATAATTYYVRATGYAEASGDIVLNVARPHAPANDDFQNAQPLGRPAHITSAIVDATLEPGEPQPSPYEVSGQSVWYRLAATMSDVVRASTCDALTASTTMVAIYTGDGVGHLTEVGHEGGACGFRTTMDFVTVPGATYYIAVRGQGNGAGEFTLDVSGPSSPPPPSNMPPPPTPTCPFVFGAGLVTYSGTHSGGGAVCLTVTKDFSGVAWFHALDIPGDTCTMPYRVIRMDPATPIVDRRFGHAEPLSRLTGSFPTARGARGSLQVTLPTGPRTSCKSPTLTWTATTTANPPWADTTPPSLRLRGSTVQRPLRQRRIVVTVQCSREPCAARASTTVAGMRLKTATLVVRAGSVRALRLALSARARRAIAAALRAHPSIRIKVTVVAADATGNRATAHRTITLRR